MQKRSFNVGVQLAAIELDPRFPICGGAPYVQKDQPITSLHVHQCLELGYCYSGSGIFVVGEKILPFHAGDVSFINHAEAHLAQSAPGTSSDWAWVFLDPLRLVTLPGVEDKVVDPTRFCGPHFENILSAQRFPGVGRIVLRIVEELRQRENGTELALRALVLELMVLIGRITPELEPAADLAQPEYDRIAPALDYMARHFSEKTDVRLLAKRCGLSDPHFRRIFQHAVGRSPLAYWHDLRLRMAASLLRTTSRSILEISQQVGFETLSSFNRLFRARYHTAPRQWRSGDGNL